MPFEFLKTEIPEVIIVKPRVFGDERGFFLETYKKSDFTKAGINGEFVQDNHSKSRKGVLRGLHYQAKPKMQGKLVRCIKGRIFDVAVDIREGSPTFGKWVGVELSEENKLMLWIPEGFAHGFLTLSEEAEIVYKVSGSEYSPEHDRSIRWNDPQIGIEWPIDKEPLLSEKDRNAPFLQEAELL
ncbi:MULTISPECIES: dTDP-4-dehydrorhamnose 3,5-epimerase [unclassified Desulfurobacterium]|uniref:dTDP-4-dehydrorhamnose 3,5-epimerase n=1 Tax=Desulfurobacterium sp. TC5-1 TaxID=1158318 RepID=UPI0003B78C72|nr:dTDP-4-dehydrorhamnose 3,5-epimerase [Desulfurobacterium sp. TC5-1]